MPLTARTRLGPYEILTLREQMHDGAIGARKAIEHAQQIAAGLGAAHARGITHRDLT